MKKLRGLSAVFVSWCLVLGGAGVGLGQYRSAQHQAALAAAPQQVPDEILVQFRPGVDRAEMAAINARHGVVEVATHGTAPFQRLKISPRKTVTEMVAAYRRNRNVVYAEPNYVARALWSPNDSLYAPYQWHLDNPEYGGIGMEAAWELSAGEEVVVAVLDTGVAYEDHEEYVSINPRRGYWVTYQRAPDLAETTFVPGFDFINGDAHPNDDEGHGTHVTGTIAQSTDNVLGAAGIAFLASIMPVKVLDDKGSGTYAAIAEGIYFAADNGARVINMSLGGGSPSITLEDALAYAHARGVTVVCASGNDGLADGVSYPAAYDEYCIAVGATRYDEAVAPYSNRGAALDLTAPGGDVTVDQNEDGADDGVLQQTFDSSPTDFGYFLYQGTSMAAPHVSGVAALVLARNPTWTPAQVRQALQATAEDKGPAGWDPDYGWGIVDAAAAVAYVGGPNTAPVAEAGPDQAVAVGQAVVFDATASSDADDGIAEYAWDFGDGSAAAGAEATATHSYGAAGTYVATLTVTDRGGLSDSDTVTIAVSETLPRGVLTADIELALGERFAGRNTFVQAVASVQITDEGTPVAGVAVRGVWNSPVAEPVTAVTDAGGTVRFTSPLVRNPATPTWFVFSVTEVTYPGYESLPAGETSDQIVY